MYIDFCAILSTWNRYQCIQKIPEKVRVQRHLLNDFHQKLIDIIFCLDTWNIKFYEILLISSRSTLAHKTFVTYTQTDKHFPEMVNSYLGYPKTCKSMKNWKSKIFAKSIFSSIYIQESNKKCLISLVWCRYFDIISHFSNNFKMHLNYYVNITAWNGGKFKLSY